MLRLGAGGRALPVEADGKPIDVPGTVASLRVVDWNGDGRQDLLCGAMGYAQGDKNGGGVYLYLDRGTEASPAFAAPIVLVPPCPKPDTDEPLRPDQALYVDLADGDGDGDQDLVVGGYSHWKPQAAAPNPEEKRRLENELAAAQARIKELDDAYARVEQGLSAEQKIEFSAGESWVHAT